MKSRIISLIIAISYLAIAFFGEGGEAFLSTLIFLILPLACIWFSEAMGGYTGIMRGQTITSATPGCFVAFGGWLLLLVPVIIGVISACTKSN